MTASKPVVLAALVPVLLGLVACGGSSSKASPSTRAESKACGTLPSADPTAKLPDGFPAVDGQVLYEPSLQGKTAIVFAVVSQRGFVAFRDSYAARLQVATADRRNGEGRTALQGPPDGPVQAQQLTCRAAVATRP